MRRMGRTVNSEIRIASSAFTAVLAVGTASVAQDYDDAAVRCYDRSATNCLMRLPGPLEPTGGGKPVVMRSAPTMSTSAAVREGSAALFKVLWGSLAAERW